MKTDVFTVIFCKAFLWSLLCHSSGEGLHLHKIPVYSSNSPSSSSFYLSVVSACVPAEPLLPPRCFWLRADMSCSLLFKSCLTFDY